MKSSKDHKDKIMDRGLNKDPLYNILINEIATTLDAETAQENDNEDGAIVHSLIRSGTRYRTEETQNNQQAPRSQNRRDTKNNTSQQNQYSRNFTRAPEKSDSLPAPLAPRPIIYVPTN